MKWLIQAFLIVVLLAVIGAGGVFYLGWQQLNTPASHNQSGEVEIPSGFSPDAAIGRLVEKGIVKNPFALKIYMRLTGAGKLVKAGVYKFTSPISPLQVLEKIESGGDALGKITIIEGWTKWDIANALARSPRLNFKDSAQALAMLEDTSEIKDISPKASSLEGYLYPDTYFLDANTTQKSLISQMVSRFRQVWNSKLQARAKEAGLSAHQVVTIASLIETEAKLPEDRPVVASVIYNRLKKRIPLALDSTIVYASKQAGKWRYDGKVYQSDIDRKSPYNTRQVIGLPPGPIGAPGLSCLEATLHPAQTDYIYYVRNPARNDGAHNFYSDAASFERGVQALRDWEKARDSAAAKSQKSDSLGIQHGTGTKQTDQPSSVKPHPSQPARTAPVKPPAAGISSTKSPGRSGASNRSHGAPRAAKSHLAPSHGVNKVKVVPKKPAASSKTKTTGKSRRKH